MQGDKRVFPKAKWIAAFARKTVCLAGSFIFFTLYSTLATAIPAQELILEPDQGRAPLLSAFRATDHSIDLAIYGLTDQILLNSLIAASQQNKKVRLLLEPQPYLATTENQKAINLLNTYPIALQWPSNHFKFLHQKTVILDSQTAIVMTFNFTHSTFSKERNFAVVVHDGAMVNEIQSVFNADFAHQPITVSQENLVWSPDNSRQKILSFIENAHQSLDVYAETISDYQIIGALGKLARNKQAVVRIILSSHPNKKMLNKLNYLRRSGVLIHENADLLIHAKTLCRDHSAAIIGSINLTKTSLDENRELSVITADPMVIKKLEAVFTRDWRDHLPKKKLLSHWRKSYHLRRWHHLLEALTQRESHWAS